MTMKTVQISKENCASVVDLLYELFYDYLLRISYSTREPGTGKIEDNHSEEEVTLKYRYSRRYHRVDWGFIVGIRGGTPSQYKDITLLFETCTVKYDLAGSTMEVEAITPGGTVLEYRLSRLRRVPEDNPWEYLSRERYDATHSKKLD